MNKVDARIIIHNFVCRLDRQGVSWADAEEWFDFGLPCDPKVDEANAVVPEAYEHFVPFVYSFRASERRNNLW